MMSESEWYASDEHFQTEMDYEDYKKKLNSGLKLPTFKELMKS